MRIILTILLQFFLVTNTFAQASLRTAEKELENFSALQNWDELIIRSLDLITSEPLQPHGYYYASLSLYHQFKLAKASELLDEVLVYGDERWKGKARGLSAKIEGLRKHFPAIMDMNSIGDITGSQWNLIWRYDKSNITAGINAVESYIRENSAEYAIVILDDPAFASIPGAKDLRGRLKSDKAVSEADRYTTLTKQGDSYFSQKKYKEAKAAYEKAYELDRHASRELPGKIRNCDDEMAWIEATEANRVEAYEKYIRDNHLKYTSQARAKIIDYMRARIQNYARQNDIALAEESFKKYVNDYKPNREETKEFEIILCELYGRHIYSLSDGKSKQEKQARLDLYYKARQICTLSEADKKEISKLEKQLK